MNALLHGIFMGITFAIIKHYEIPKKVMELIN